MKSRRVRIVSVLAAGGLLLVGCGDGDGDGAAPTTSSSLPTTTPTSATTAVTTPTPTTVAGQVVEVSFLNGQVQAASQQVEVDLGETVVLRVTSDVVDEVHVHTYDEYLDLQAGIPGEIVFEADIPGRHEIELESRHRRLLTLVVS